MSEKENWYAHVILCIRGKLYSVTRVLKINSLRNCMESGNNSIYAQHILITVTIWALWKNRNKVVFNNKLANIGRIKEEIEIYSYLWIKHRAKCGSLSWIDWCNFDLIAMGV
ncbi:hypothetical protein HanPSC8_Chr06g0269351 [Helianthus annuus]|nr:hypothetical protein HanPSC8_Chr06g0269351 [Helianthus annuus]